MRINNTFDLAALVRGERKRAGLTLPQLAERVGVERKVVIRLEKGDGGVGIGTVMDILRVLQVQLNFAPEALPVASSSDARTTAEPEIAPALTSPSQSAASPSTQTPSATPPTSIRPSQASTSPGKRPFIDVNALVDGDD